MPFGNAQAALFRSPARANFHTLQLAIFTTFNPVRVGKNPSLWKKDFSAKNLFFDAG